jgi:hypothetical protein
MINISFLRVSVTAFRTEVKTTEARAIEICFWVRELLELGKEYRAGGVD